jgi:hypothetical protein
MANLIQLRRDTSTAWNNVDPVLNAGEPGVETNSGKLKIGNGVLRWKQLPYVKSSELPPNAIGYLNNDGQGNISWIVVPPPFSKSYTDLINKPNFAPVAFTNSYNSLINKPFIPTDYSQLTDNTNILGIISEFNTLANKFRGFDCGPILTNDVQSKLEWILLSIDIDNGTITLPVNISHDAGTLI